MLDMEWVSSSLCRDKSCVVFQIMPPPRDEHMSTNSWSIKSDYCDHNNIIAKVKKDVLDARKNERHLWYCLSFDLRQTNRLTRG